MEFDFAANAEVDDVQLVPEQFRGAYVQNGDKFVIADPYKPFTSLVTGLAGSLKASRAEAKTAKGAAKVDLAPLAAFGTTPAEIAEKVNSQITELTEKLNSGQKLDPEKMRADIAKSFQTQIAEKDQTIASMNKSLNTHLVSSEATRAIAENKGVPDLLLPHIERQVKVVVENGTYKSVVVDKDGDTRISGTTGQPMTISELVKEMKATTTFGRAFESEAAQGTGTRPGVKTPVSPTGRNAATLTSLEKIEAGLNTRGSR